MRRVIHILLLLLIISMTASLLAASELCPPPLPGSGADPVDLCDNVYRIRCSPHNRISSGFKTAIDGTTGIVTTLHGVTGCDQISAFNLKQSIPDLQVSRVNVRLDVTFLTSPSLVYSSSSGLLTTSDFQSTDLRVVGYPQGLQFQLSHVVELHARALVMLRELLPSRAGADGGLGGGTLNIGWAIPYSSIDWHDSSAYRNELNRLAQEDAETLFGFSSSEVQAKIPGLYFTDAGDPIGRIYRFQNGTIDEYYKRSKGQIYNIAISPKGAIYFSNSNDNDLYRLRGKEEIKVYTHTTYLRDVEFDPLGRLYFSESTGAGGDGVIYRLEDGRAYSYFQVRLKEVDGFWAGGFAFDNDGFLWLSSGNRVPAHLYKVVEFKPRRMFTSSGSISGFCFIEDGSLIYTDWRHTLYRLTPSDFLATKVKSFGLIRWLSDVAPIPSTHSSQSSVPSGSTGTRSLQNGYYEIQAMHSGKCLDVPRSSTQDGVNIIQYKCGNTKNQRWKLTEGPTGFYEIQAMHSGKCLDVPRSSTQDEVKIIQYKCGNTKNQRWKLTEGPTGFYEIRAMHSDKCLDVPRSSPQDGVNIIQYKCGNTKNRRWKLTFKHQ